MDAKARNEWRTFLRGYVRFCVAIGLPCAVVAVCLRTMLPVVMWFYFSLTLPVGLAIITAIYAVTAWPFLLLLAALFGRGGPTLKGDPDGPGVIVCR